MTRKHLYDSFCPAMIDFTKNDDYILSFKIDPNSQLLFLGSCPLHAEDLLSQEIVALGGEVTETLRAGLYFRGTLSVFYRCCLWARTASSFKLVIKRFQAKDRNEFYQQILKNPWFDHLSSATSFATHVTSSNKTFAPNHFLALVVKDAIADSFTKISRPRPSVNAQHPDIVIHVHMDGTNGTLCLELGRALHERSWRVQAQESEHATIIKKQHNPAQENLLAVLLYRAHWPKFAKQGLPFVDGICDNGMTLIEAYTMATDYAPQLKKAKIGFEHWLQHDPKIWEDLRAEAQERYEQGQNTNLEFYGYDTYEKSLKMAQDYCEKAGFSSVIKFKKEPLLSILPKGDAGFMIINPKFGERLLQKENLQEFYQSLAQHLKAKYAGWNIALTLPTEDALRYLDVRTDRLNTFYHGAEKRVLARFSLFNSQVAPSLSKAAEKLKTYIQERYDTLGNLAQKKWKTNVYRLYNAEKEAYRALCDIYENTLVVQPFETSPEIKELTRVCQEVTGIDRMNTVIKKRRKMRKEEQYEAEKDLVPVEKIIHERGLQFSVNLSAYIDTGFYLDHRALRFWLHKECTNKSFLNLFCYTGAMSIVAAKAGASKVCSVDVSKTYLGIAQRNAKLNRLDTPLLEWVRSDVMDFVQKKPSLWDLIYVDPPTYSNGTGRNHFDIHKDHPRLLKACMKLLAHGGKLYFSTHARKFQLDSSLMKEYFIKELTDSSLDEDCSVGPRVHSLWEIRKRNHVATRS